MGFSDFIQSGLAEVTGAVEGATDTASEAVEGAADTASDATSVFGDAEQTVVDGVDVITNPLGGLFG